MLKRPKSHQIDSAAKKVFENCLPDSWAVNEQPNDYGKDYHVESAEQSLMSGEAFYVQLKGHGTAKLNKTKTAVKHAFKKKHLAYYADKVTQIPVFCVVVDVTTKKAWYLFLQQYLFNLPGWRQQNETTIYLPLENDLQDTERFMTAITEAKAWIRRKNPYALGDAHAQEIEKLKSIEPRCDYKVSLIDGISHCELRPLEDMPMRMHIEGQKSTMGSKIENLMKGHQVWFDPGECKIEGTDLFKEIYEKGGSFQVQTTKVLKLNLILKDDANAVIGTLPGIDGQFASGITETTYRGKLGNSPLSIEVGPLHLKQSGICKARFAFDPTAWFGQRVDRLAYFVQLNEFVEAALKATSCHIQWVDDGNLVVSIAGTGLSKDLIEHMSESLSFINAIRMVCKRLKIKAIYGEELLAHAERFDQLFTMLFEGGWKGPFDDSFIDVESSGFIDMPSEPWNYRLLMPCNFLGKEVGTSFIDLSNVTPEVSQKEDGLYLVRFNGNPGSIRTLNLLEGEVRKPTIMSMKPECKDA